MVAARMSTPAREELAKLYRQMLQIRRFEEAAARAYSQGHIGGFLHLYIGQEACATGVLAALEPRDYVVTTYRDHAQALLRGVSPRAAMAELYGKVTGCSKGLGGSMHFFHAENRMLGGYGIVGGHVPIAAGAAFSAKYRGEGAVAVCFFGEGSATIGAFHEALGLAALWKLPLVLLCENNEYAMGTPLSRTLSVDDVSLKALGYGIERDRVVAEDVLHVRDRVAVAVERARSHSLPTLIELKTYRFRGHSMSDPGKYRSAEEVEERKKRDPLLIAERKLLEWGSTQAELDRAGLEVEAEIEDAVQFAQQSPEPGEELIEAFTYA